VKLKQRNKKLINKLMLIDNSIYKYFFFFPSQNGIKKQKIKNKKQKNKNKKALIVRIMKTRKKLHHNQLVEQILRESKSRFNPSIPALKKCIEGLIEKAYLERDKTVREVYLYVA